MGFLKKLIISSILILILLSLSYLPYDIGVFSFKFIGLEVSAPTNFVLSAFIIIWMGVSIISIILQALSSIFVKDKTKIEKDSEKALINLIFAKSISDINNCNVCEKYEKLKEAVECSLFDKFKQCPPKPLEINNFNTTLTIHKIRLNIRKYISDNDIKSASLLTQEAINKYPAYVYVIKDEIFYISNNIKLEFDPKKYKYNLSRQYADEYAIIAIMRDFNLTKNIAILEKAHKKYPSNAEIATELIKNSPNFNEKRAISIVKVCFAEKPNRLLASALLLFKKHEDLFEIATQITESVQNDNLEKLWFLCAIATEMGHISKASELLQTIVKNHPKEMTKVIEFFVLNHSRFSNNIELIQLIKEHIKNENRNNKVT